MGGLADLFGGLDLSPLKELNNEVRLLREEIAGLRADLKAVESDPSSMKSHALGLVAALAKRLDKKVPE